MIIELGENETNSNKRYYAIIENQKGRTRTIYFGLKNPKIGTFIDHHDLNLRKAYIARHYGNEKERYLIDNLIPSASLLSAALLWSFFDSSSTNLVKNIMILNSMWKKKHSNK